MHAVQQLYLYRKSIANREFKGRGWKLVRCPECRVCIHSCICDLVQQSDSDAAFLLLMYDNEVLKPSNTGWLIADVVKDTHAYLWHRTEVHPGLEALLKSDKYQPFLVFPKAYAADGQAVYEQKPDMGDPISKKKPLFVLIDSTWRQAKKILRKSPYLMDLPMLSIPSSMMVKREFSDVDRVNENAETHPNQTSTSLTNNNFDSKYQVRKADKEGEFATAEVAAKVLALFEHKRAAEHLDLWFEVFAYRYQEGVKQRNKGNPRAVSQYLSFLERK